jgi:hypothetical protein
MFHTVVDVVSLSRVPCGLVLLVLCMSFVTLFCLPADMAVFVCTVIIFVELFSHSVEAVQVVKDVECKVVFARNRMLVLLNVVGQILFRVISSGVMAGYSYRRSSAHAASMAGLGLPK